LEKNLVNFYLTPRIFFVHIKKQVNYSKYLYCFASTLKNSKSQEHLEQYQFKQFKRKDQSIRICAGKTNDKDLLFLKADRPC